MSATLPGASGATAAGGAAAVAVGEEDLQLASAIEVSKKEAADKQQVSFVQCSHCNDFIDERSASSHRCGINPPTATAPPAAAPLTLLMKLKKKIFGLIDARSVSMGGNLTATEIAKRKGEFKSYFYTPALQAITQDKDNKAAVVQVLEAVEEMGEDADADDILYSLEQCGDGFELATPSDVLSQS